MGVSPQPGQRKAVVALEFRRMPQEVQCSVTRAMAMGAARREQPLNLPGKVHAFVKRFEPVSGQRAKGTGQRRDQGATGPGSPAGDELAVLCSLLANPHRLALVRRLVAGEAAAGDLARATRASASATSNRLKELGAGGLVEARRDGRRVLHRLMIPETRRVLARLDAFASLAAAHRPRPPSAVSGGRTPFDARERRTYK